MRRPIALLLPTVVALPLAWSTVPSSPAAAAECSVAAEPEYAGRMPTGQEVLGYDIGSQEASAADLNAYLDAVDAASDEVTTGTIGRSVDGRPLRYAVVGDRRDVTRAQRAARTLRDPDTSRAEAARIAESAPAITWMAGNVHGNEESGADASLAMLYALTDRTDCAAQLIRDNTVTVIIPTQNPDGREMDTRRNAYGFDLNRDWFARTQAETDGKVDLLWKYPPLLMSDNHEMGGTEFFFPPNADPVYHDISDQSVSWINERYGGAMADEFDRRGWPHFSYSVYDLLYMGYGDTVPVTMLNSASMTYEKGGASPIPERTEQQFVASWASMYALAQERETTLRQWAASYRLARAQGEAGQLEPNKVFAPDSTLELQVPDEKVRHYFIRPSRAKRPEVRALVRRLQRAEVDVYRLRAPLRVPDYRAYGRSPKRTVLPPGTLWVPMAQAQKHWIQAMLGEDSYVPFPYFYDVTAWSGPLLFNLAGGRSGAVLRPRATKVDRVGAPAQPRIPRTAGSVGLWLVDDSTAAYESEGWARWLLTEKWGLPYRSITTPEIGEGVLDAVDVLVVPNGDAEDAYAALGAAGRAAVRAWVRDGGRFVGYRGGGELASRLGLTTAQFRAPQSDVPGSLIRARTTRSPLTRGVGKTVWSFYEYDSVLRVARPSGAAVSYPPAGSSDWFVSGYQRGAEELGGTAAVVAERYRKGRVVVFAGDPNFRAFTDGTQRILWNAIVVPDPAPRAPDASRVAARRPVDATPAPAAYAQRLVVTARATAEGRVLRALDGYGTDRQVESLADGLVRVSVATPDTDGSVREDRVVARLRDLGTRVVAVRVP